VAIPHAPDLLRRATRPATRSVRSPVRSGRDAATAGVCPMTIMSSSTLPATRRVLVLEDNPTLLRIIGSMLARNGCEVALCQEIEAAETLLSRQKYAVLVTDLNVSALGGAEGIRLARFSKTHFPECRVVIAR